MSELIDKPLVDDAIDAYVDWREERASVGMPTSAGRAGRRPIPRWRSRRIGPRSIERSARRTSTPAC